MEIISQITEKANTVPGWVFVVLVIVGIIGVLLFLYGLDEYEDWAMIMGAIIVLSCALLAWACASHNSEAKAPEYRYRIRVDKETPIGEVLKTYDIVEYDKEYDVWIVDLKKNTTD